MIPNSRTFRSKRYEFLIGSQTTTSIYARALWVSCRKANFHKHEILSLVILLVPVRLKMITKEESIPIHARHFECGLRLDETV